MQIPGFDLYGGATVTTIIDGSGAEWIACCAKKSADGTFGFRLFRNRVEVVYSPFCSGRGSINGGGKWIAWEGSAFFTGSIPGFVPFPAAGPGPAGPQGPAGPTGPQGPQGPQGIPGPAGDGEGGLTAEQLAVLQYLVSVYGPLLGI